MSLAAHLVVRRPSFRLDLRLDARPGEVVALLGPNGAGKSTVLRALAGLVRLSSGQITVDGTPWDGPDGFVPPERRRVGLVFQDYLLFPHLSIVDNVAFGPRCHGLPRAQAHRLALDLLTRLGVPDHAWAKPAQLSGGQAQRVALARALAVSPRLLLLDEPLAALDAGTRLEVRAELRRHLAEYDGICVLVTHDPLDAMALAQRIVVVEDGRVAQTGTAMEITRRPRTTYVARLAGLNLYRGRARDGLVELAGGGRLAVDEPLTGEVFVAFPPSAVALYRQRPEGSPRNVWPVAVTGVERYGDRVRVELSGVPTVAADITAPAAAELELLPGKELWVSVKATETHAYPA